MPKVAISKAKAGSPAQYVMLNIKTNVSSFTDDISFLSEQQKQSLQSLGVLIANAPNPIRIKANAMYSVIFIDGSCRNNVKGSILIRYMSEPTRTRSIKSFTEII